MLPNKLPQNLGAYNNNNYLLSLMVLWVRDSDSTVSEISAGRLEKQRLRSSESSLTLMKALKGLSAGTLTHGFPTWPVFLHMVTACQGLAWLSLQQRPCHSDASWKVMSTMESRLSGREKKEREREKWEKRRPQVAMFA